MLKILKFLSPDKKNIAIVALLLLVSTLANLALPTLMSMIVDTGINNMDINFIWKVSLVMFTIAIVGLATMIISVKISAGVTSRFSNSIRTAVFKKVNTLPFKKLNELGTGALITRSTEDIWMIEEVAYFIMRGSVTIPVLVLGGTILAVMKDAWLALIMFSSTPILLVALYFISKRIKPLWDISDKYIDKQNSIIRERLSGIRVIRAFNREDKERAKANSATKIMATNIIKSNVQTGLISPLSVFLLNIVIILIVFVGASRMENPANFLSAGDVIAIIQYVSLVMSGIISMSFAVAFLPRVKVNSKRINEVLQAESLPEANDLEKESFCGNIRFDNVSFSYEGAAEPALSEVSFNIKKGERVAFIGGTGAGKSTIVQLLMGFYPKTTGEIFFDDMPMSEMSAQRVRQNISCVLQKTTLFEGTIKSNIMMSNPSATEQQMKEAADVSELKRFIGELNNGFDYEILPNGTNLSGGQKQRISIARGLLKEAAIYLFDDSFSALDFLTESKIRKRLSKTLVEKTQLIITQRVTSAMSCDNIFVMDKGKLVAEGKHKQLLENCAVYREIYLSQTGGALK
ncbi:MAG: ABC transporter ATP-binding protein [Clostridia bacterium]|nr:ABC transporter ATP-binding protein [Clostridia bacterium]